MKKKICLILALCLAFASTFAGCGKSTSTTSSDTTAESIFEDISTAATGAGRSNDMFGMGGSSSTAAVGGDGITVEFEEITSWTLQATITLSGSSATISGSGATFTDGVILITDGGSYSISGSSTDVAIMVNSSEDVKIILNGVTMSVSTGPVIYGYDCDSLYIELADGTTNTLSDGSTYETDDDGNTIGKAVICCEDDLILTGTGSAVITANYKHGISSDDSLYALDGNYTITCNGTDGIHANDLIAIYGGTYDITAVSDIIQSENDLIIYDCTINGTSQDEGIEAKADMIIEGGTINISVKDDGFNTGYTLTINGGNIYVTCTTGDALDSNGSMEINGGYIVAYGGGAPEGALDCDESSIPINGGTVIAVGDTNSEIDSNSEQISIWLGQYTAGNVITITTEDGTEILSFTYEYSQSNMIISCPDFEMDETYYIYVDGELNTSFTVDSQVMEVSGSSVSVGGGNMGGNMQQTTPDNMQQTTPGGNVGGGMMMQP